MSCVLAFDYGTRSVGVAVGNELTCSATPLPAVRLAPGTCAHNLQRFAPLFACWQPRYVVVGSPLNMDGTRQSMTARAQRFGRALAAHFRVGLHFADERLTTVSARELLFEQEGYRGLRKGRVDSVAAALILESFLSAGRDCGSAGAGGSPWM